MVSPAGPISGPGSRLEGIEPARPQTAGERAARFQPKTAAAETAQGNAASRDAPSAARSRTETPQEPLPFLRRRTDLGDAPEARALDLPGHLERRRAWREAKGLGTFHAQRLAQRDETELDPGSRSHAMIAYRHYHGRGRLDLELAQKVSVTV